MIDNDSLRRALVTLETYAPAEERVLAGLREGIARRRRHRQVASVAGVAGLASVVALGVVLVAPDRGVDGGSSPASVPSTPSSSDSSDRTGTPPAPPALPFTAGSLPSGYWLGAWWIGPDGAGTQWRGERDDEDPIDVNLWPKMHETGPYVSDVPTTVNGRPGRLRKQPKGMLELSWQVADGRWFTVSQGREEAPLRAIAAGMSTRPAPLDPVSGPALRSLPDGYLVNLTSGFRSEVSGIELCRSPVAIDSTTARPADCIMLWVRPGTAPATYETSQRGDLPATSEPVDQEKVVNGRTTRANAAGTVVYVQIDAGHWGTASSRGAGVDVLREAVSYLVNR